VNAKAIVANLCINLQHFLSSTRYRDQNVYLRLLKNPFDIPTTGRKLINEVFKTFKGQIDPPSMRKGFLHRRGVDSTLESFENFITLYLLHALDYSDGVTFHGFLDEWGFNSLAWPDRYFFGVALID